MNGDFMPAAQKNADEDKIMYLVAYVIPVITGIFVYFLYADKNKNLKFHGVQSIIYGVVTIVVYYILLAVFGVVGMFLLGWILSLFWLLAWLYGLYVGYEAMLGHDIEIPAVSNIAKSAV